MCHCFGVVESKVINLLVSADIDTCQQYRIIFGIFDPILTSTDTALVLKLRLYFPYNPTSEKLKKKEKYGKKKPYRHSDSIVQKTNML